MRDTENRKNIDTITFSSKQSINVAQHCQCDVVKEPFGVEGVAKDITTELEAISLFIVDVVLVQKKG